MRRAGLEQHLREPTGARPDVQAALAGDREPGLTEPAAEPPAACMRPAPPTGRAPRRGRSRSSGLTGVLGLVAGAPSTRTAPRVTSSRAWARLRARPRRTSSASRRALPASGPRWVGVSHRRGRPAGPAAPGAPPRRPRPARRGTRTRRCRGAAASAASTSASPVGVPARPRLSGAGSDAHSPDASMPAVMRRFPYRAPPTSVAADFLAADFFAVDFVAVALVAAAFFVVTAPDGRAGVDAARLGGGRLRGGRLRRRGLLSWPPSSPVRPSSSAAFFVGGLLGGGLLRGGLLGGVALFVAALLVAGLLRRRPSWSAPPWSPAFVAGAALARGAAGLGRAARSGATGAVVTGVGGHRTGRRLVGDLLARRTPTRRGGDRLVDAGR